MYTISVIKGDGIGPEVINQSLLLLKGIGFSFKMKECFAGYGCYLKHGTPLPEETVKICKNSDAILFGAVTTPPGIENYFSPIVRLRKVLNLFANIRPIYSLPIKESKRNIDFIIVRENTEDLYSGIERLTPQGAEAVRIITRSASEKIIKFAFDIAVKEKRKKVTVVHKANILRLTDGLFIKTAENLHKGYPDINLEYMLVDSAGLSMVRKPEIFDVIVTTNMFGDILSDVAAGLVGGLGIASSANIGDRNALFEPVHGSAPKYEVKNISNPYASFFSVCLMLEYLGQVQIAHGLKQAIFTALRKGLTTADLGGKLKTNQVAKEVINIYLRNI